MFVWIIAVIWASQFKFTDDFSPVLFSKEGKVLSVKVAKDGQWRFKKNVELPENYVKCLLQFEDKNFYLHLGVDPIGLIRAAYLNFKKGRVVSGGSTITMQVARLILNSPNRNVIRKFSEIVLAIGIEFRYSKKQILQLYSELAPYGSNVIGVEAAMIRYYNKSLKDLSWSEAAMLAVLPNQPSLIHIGKNRVKLIEKRNQLLKNLFEKHLISKESFELSLLEPIPQKPEKLNRLAPHALDYLQARYPGQFIFKSNIDSKLQSVVQEICGRHHNVLAQNEIRNLAVLVVSNSDQKVLSYIGNMVNDTQAVAQAEVNMIHAPRSSGSILKPLLV
ncbi:MAG: transglycosylase domain-containing protein, partial [Saprospiraceae bacterium]